MKKILWVLPLLANAQDYSFITTECDGEKATVVLEYTGSEEPDWGDFETARTGACEEGVAANFGMERVYSEDGKKMMVTFDPYSCSETTPNPADVTTYNVDIQVTFGESADGAVVIDGKTLGMGGGSGFFWMMQAQCTFSSSYTTSADFHVTQTGESESYDLGAGEQLLEFEALGTDEMFQAARGDDEYTTDDIVYHIVGLSTDLATRSSDNAWAFPTRDMWRNFHVAPISVQVKSGSWTFDLLTSEMSYCGYSQLGFRAVGFHEDHEVESENPMGTFAWGFAYKGFTADDADASDLTLEVTLALCHKDDPNNACVAVLQKCSERQVNPTVPDEVPCEDREGYAGEHYLLDQFGECQFSGFECDCANGTPGYDSECMYNTVEKCASCDDTHELNTILDTCEIKPPTPCEDRDGFDANGNGDWELDHNGVCQPTAQKCSCPYGTGDFHEECERNAGIVLCSACEDTHELEWDDTCERKPDARTIEDINNAACLDFNEETWVNGEHGEWTDGLNIGTVHATDMVNHPDKYDSNLNCIWNFRVPAGKQLYLTKVRFSVEPESSCSYDKFYVQYTYDFDNVGEEKCVPRIQTDAYEGDPNGDQCLFCSFVATERQFLDTPWAVPNNEGADQKVMLLFRTDGADEFSGIDFSWEIK